MFPLTSLWITLNASLSLRSIFTLVSEINEFIAATLAEPWSDIVTLGINPVLKIALRISLCIRFKIDVNLYKAFYGMKNLLFLPGNYNAFPCLRNTYRKNKLTKEPLMKKSQSLYPSANEH